MTWVKPIDNGVEIDIQVVPRASRTRIVGIHEGRLKLQLTAPPVDGEANKALIIFLAKSLRVKKSAVELISGETAKKKRLRVEGVDEAQVRALLA